MLFGDERKELEVGNKSIQINKLFKSKSIQYNTIQYNTIQYNTIQYNTIQYNTIQYNKIYLSTVESSVYIYKFKHAKINKRI